MQFTELLCAYYCFAGGAFVAGDALMYTGTYVYWMKYLAKQVGISGGRGREAVLQHVCA